MSARTRPIPNIPDRELYRPRFHPWCETEGEFGDLMRQIKPHTLVSEESCFALFSLARQAVQLPGDFWECGVHHGGSAMLLAEVLRRYRSPRSAHRLRLFDTFTGMPPIDPEHDLHYPKRDQREPEELAEATLEAVQTRLAPYREEAPKIAIHCHAGLLPETFAGRETDRIALAHIDVDLYRSIHSACAFIYPRLVPGGVMVFDDYGYPSCPGARRAVDEFFADKPEVPLVSPTAQALVFKLPDVTLDGEPDFEEIADG